MESLQTIGMRQASWSTTANRLKATLDRVRRAGFALSILGAALATLASQSEGGPRRALAIAGAVALAITAFFTARLGSAQQVSGWVRARAAAEALKRDAFKFAAGAAPYDQPATAEQRLTEERRAIEDPLDDLAGLLVEVARPGSTPTAPLAPADYLDRRVKGQIDYYRTRAAEAALSARRLRAMELVLALLATVITAVVGVLDKYPLAGLPFDLAALTAILTTVGGTILSHIEASRYDFLVRTYRATARRLDDALTDLPTLPPAPSAPWSAFVERCENIIAAENSSWVAKWDGR
jgi:hypothetical protein